MNKIKVYDIVTTIVGGVIILFETHFLAAFLNELFDWHKFVNVFIITIFIIVTSYHWCNLTEIAKRKLFKKDWWRG